ncbi:MAG TPA: DUF5985 family protein [Kofleriaceae bacterium]|nr:DUF5985 family protein [Kofleriaceae bacterium]
MSSYLPAVVYVLCALTSLLCVLLLLRSYRRSGQRLLLLIGLCFAGLTLNNILLPVDLLWLRTEVDLSVLRSAVGFLAVAVLLVVLIWEAR